MSQFADITFSFFPTKQQSPLDQLSRAQAVTTNILPLYTDLTV